LREKERKEGSGLGARGFWEVILEDLVCRWLAVTQAKENGKGLM